DVLEMERIEAIAVRARTEVEVVLARTFANERDLRQVRPRTPVRTSAGAHRDRCALESKVLQRLTKLRNQRRQIALALGHREAARRERDARHRMQSECVRRRIVLDPMGTQQRLDARAITLLDT